MGIFGSMIQPAYLLLDNVVLSILRMLSKSEEMPDIVLDKRAEIFRSLYPLLVNFTKKTCSVHYSFLNASYLA